MTNLQPIRKVTAKTAAYLSRSSKSTLLLGAIIFVSSSQLARHFWPASAYVYGSRVDYLSPAIYLLDIVISTWIVLYSNVRNAKIDNSKLQAIYPILLVNLLFSANPLATLVWSARFVLYGVFIASALPRMRKIAPMILLLAMAFQVLLGSVQTMVGHTIQGPFYWLGERLLNVSSPNVAKWSWNGETLLRSYGTFSHPNILAGWLITTFLIVVSTTKSWRIRTIVGVVTALGIGLAQSRAAIFSFMGIIVPLYFLSSTRSRIIYFSSIILIICFLSPISLLNERLDTSIIERLDLQKVSVQIIQTSPIFGSGANAAISLYPAVSPSWRVLQPDHNSLTLLLSWFGLIGILALVSVFQLSSFNLKKLLPLLPLLLLDHYFLTSVQGLFILLPYLRLLANQSTGNW